MRKEIIQDKIFNVYTKLPHCQYLRRKHINEVQKRFNYKDLSDISIFSANCVGGEIYSLLGLQFRSPLINVSIDRDTFIVLCAHLQDYLSQTIRVSVAENGSCIGILGDDKLLPKIEIRFPHDNKPEKVYDNWRRRCSRINWEKLVLIVDDKGLKGKDYELFDRIPAFRKICLCSKNNVKYKWCHELKEYGENNCTGEYNQKTIDGLWKFTKIWDYVEFLNHG